KKKKITFRRVEKLRAIPIPGSLDLHRRANRTRRGYKWPTNEPISYSSKAAILSVDHPHPVGRPRASLPSPSTNNNNNNNNTTATTSTPTTVSTITLDKEEEEEEDLHDEITEATKRTRSAIGLLGVLLSLAPLSSPAHPALSPNSPLLRQSRRDHKKHDAPRESISVGDSGTTIVNPGDESS
ncbi:hypothetical protein ALC53_13010, partial [Atta colombica]